VIHKDGGGPDLTVGRPATPAGGDWGNSWSLGRWLVAPSVPWPRTRTHLWKLRPSNCQRCLRSVDLRRLARWQLYASCQQL